MANKFATIIKKRDRHIQPEIYHGIILSRNNDYFTFAYRINDKNIIMENCGLDYWDLIE